MLGKLKEVLMFFAWIWLFTRFVGVDVTVYKGPWLNQVLRCASNVQACVGMEPSRVQVKP